MAGKHAVGRVVARPFTGIPGSFVRTSHRHDFSLEPPGCTLLDIMKDNQLDVIGIGKINDILQVVVLQNTPTLPAMLME